MSKLRWGIALTIAVGLIIMVLLSDFSAGLGASLITITGLGLNLDNVVLVAPLVRQLPPWGRRVFFTVGMLVSVVGVQLLLPIAIVAWVNHAGVGHTIGLAWFHTRDYSHLQGAASQFIGAGAWTLLALMALNHFLDPEKHVHWLKRVEIPLAKLGEHAYLSFGVVGAASMILAAFAPTDNRLLLVFVCFGSFVAYAFFHMAGSEITRRSVESAKQTAQAVWYKILGRLAFIMVLESLFSIDSLASAFAISTAIVPIVTGLVASGLFMRALLFDVSESDVLSQFKYLYTAAFWAVMFLAVVTYFNTFGIKVPDLVTGFGGTAIIVAGIYHSHLENRRTALRPAVA